jgi:hypothetical protein
MEEISTQISHFIEMFGPQCRISWGKAIQMPRIFINKDQIIQ